MKATTTGPTRADTEAAHLVDTLFNPRLQVYRYLAHWEAWYALAKAGRRPPILILKKQEAANDI